MLWRKVISLEQLAAMEMQIPQLLADLEQLLPARELDINYHMMVHLVDTIRERGPCWASSMYGFERLWGRMVRWLHQRSHPEATILNAFKAMKVAFMAVSHLAADEQAEANDNLEGEDSAAAEVGLSKNFCLLPPTFNKSNNQLILPQHLEVHASLQVQLFDSGGSKGGMEYFGAHSQHRDQHHRRAELHKFYVKFPEFCRSCACPEPAPGQPRCHCPSYAQLWQQFQDEQPVPRELRQIAKRDMPALLAEWHTWALQQPAFTRHQQDVCYGPILHLRVYHRAQIDGTIFASAAIEGVGKKARDSIVLMRDGAEGTLWAGRVKTFISHRPPGCEAIEANEANIADIAWFNQVPGNDPNHNLPSIGCPAFKSSIFKDPTGNFWPVERLGTCKVAAVPHPTRRNQLVILSRFADFLKQVPRGCSAHLSSSAISSHHVSISISLGLSRGVTSVSARIAPPPPPIPPPRRAGDQRVAMNRQRLPDYTPSYPQLD